MVYSKLACYLSWLNNMKGVIILMKFLITQITKMLSLTLYLLVIFGLFSRPTHAAVAPPELTGVYPKDGHVKLEWSAEINPADIMTSTSFDPHELLPDFGGAAEWNGDGNQKYSTEGYEGRSIQLDDVVSNRSGNMYWFPQLDSDRSSSIFPGVSFPNGSNLSVTFKARNLGGTGDVKFDFRGEWLNKGFPMKDLSGKTLYFAENVDFANAPNSFGVQLVDGSEPNLQNGQVYVVVTSHNEDYNYGGRFYSWNAANKVMEYDVSRSYIFTTKRAIDGHPYVGNTDSFVSGEPVLHLHNSKVEIFEGRSVSSDGEWHTYSLNTKLDEPNYDVEANGLHPIISWSTDGILQVDDLQFGYATEAEVYRDGQPIYRGYLSDHVDIEAVDHEAPDVLKNVTVRLSSKREPVISWDEGLDQGTTYAYQVKGYPKQSVATVISDETKVTMTSGIKGYSIIIDQNSDTKPTSQISTAQTEFNAGFPVSGNFYVHIAAVDFQGNVSEATHIKYEDIINPELTIVSSTTEWTKDPVILSVSALDHETGIQRIQLPNGEWHYGDTKDYAVHQNGVYSFIAEDYAGNQTQREIEVANMDTEGPGVSITPDQRSWSADDIDVSLHYDDVLSGLDLNGRLYKVTNSPEEPIHWNIASDVEPHILIKTEGIWYVHAKAIDKVGNVTILTTQALQLQHVPEVPQVKINGTDEASVYLEWALPSSTYTGGYTYEIQNLTTGEKHSVAYPLNSFVIHSLSPGMSYEFQVKVTNHVGEKYSEIIQVQTLPGVPEGINIQKVERQADQALVTFDSVNSATSYRIRFVDPVSGTEVYNQIVQGTDQQFIDNLQPGTQYEVSISAINLTGEGNPGRSGFLTLPDTPSGFSAVQFTEDTVKLQWSNAEAEISSTLEREEQEIYHGAATEYVDHGLNSGTAYQYRVFASNQTGDGMYSVLPEVWTLPGEISDLSSIATDNSINFQWEAVTGAEGYLINIDGQEISVAQGNKGYVLEDVDPGATYSFKIRAYNRSGSSKTSQLFAAALPSSPSVVKVENVGENEAVLEFLPVFGASKYKVSVNGMIYEVSASPVHITGLEGGKIYTYEVQAGNSSGYGQGTGGQFLTLPSMVSDFKIKSSSSDMVEFTWGAVESVTSYLVLDGDLNVLSEQSENVYKQDLLESVASYTFYIIAQNNSGKSFPASFKWKTIPNSEQLNVVIKDRTENTISYSWTDIDGADGYKIWNEEGHLIQDVIGTKATINHLNSAFTVENWSITPYNSGGLGEKVTIESASTKPSDQYRIDIIAEETRLKFHFLHELKYERFVITYQNKVVFRGRDKEFILSGLKSGMVYPFKVWTENELGEKSKVKEVTGRILSSTIVNPPTENGSSYPNVTKSVEDVEENIQTPGIENPVPHIPVISLPFNDLDRTFGSKEIVELYNLGVLQGVQAGVFDPKRPITRIEFGTIIVRLAGLQPTGEKQLTFQDIHSAAWYITPLHAAIDHGVAKGFSDSEFRPDALINREQAAKMIANYFYNKDALGSDKLLFRDESLIVPWAKKEVKSLAMDQLLKGYPDGTFKPKNSITREESAVLLYRLLLAIKN